jgi:hypothetical protein
MHPSVLAVRLAVLSLISNFSKTFLLIQTPRLQVSVGECDLINAIPLSSSACAHRSSLWIFQHYASHSASVTSPFPPETLAFVAGLNNNLEDAQPDGDFAAYLNYVDLTLSVEEAHQLYYGSNLTARLEGIKGEVDPGNVFWNPQGILPSV